MECIDKEVASVCEVGRLSTGRQSDIQAPTIWQVGEIYWLLLLFLGVNGCYQTDTAI